MLSTKSNVFPTHVFFSVRSKIHTNIHHLNVSVRLKMRRHTRHNPPYCNYVLTYWIFVWYNFWMMQAFLAAWQKACMVSNGVIYAPSGYTFLVYPSTYSGPCHANTHFKVGSCYLGHPTWTIFSARSNDFNHSHFYGKCCTGTVSGWHLGIIGRDPLFFSFSNIDMFPNHMLTSFGFSLLNWGIFCKYL